MPARKAPRPVTLMPPPKPTGPAPTSPVGPTWRGGAPVNLALPPITLGWVIALIVAILAIVLGFLGRLPLLEATLISLVAVARLV
jgi:hypothetical protein